MKFVFFKLNEKTATALLSVISNTVLTSLKIVTGIITGSISLLSEGFHSFGDLLASFVALGSIVESNKPADNDHQFGHGKFEDLAGFIEAALIILSAFFVLYAGFEKIITKNISHTFNADYAIGIMVLSVIINLWVGKLLLKKGEETDSCALTGDGHHLLADVYSSLAVIAGLIAVKLTGHYILDPIIAIMVGTMILKTGCSLIKTTASKLLDESLPKENLETIGNILEEHKAHGLLGVKTIRTSKSGSTKNIVLIIYLNPETTLKDTHILCDKIENEIEEKLKNTSIVIHAEPCDNLQNNAKEIDFSEIF